MRRLVIVLAFASISLWPAAVAEGSNLQVTGGTNGAACNSGGYFTPSSINATAGDTITFSVPANDPYAGGLQVNGFPQGSFVVPTGGSVTTQPLAAGTINFNGTWPNAPGCPKGSGTVTVAAAPPPPPPPPPPSPSGGGTTSGGSTSSGGTTTTPKSTNTSTQTSSPTPTTTTTNTQPTTTSQPTSTTQTQTSKTIQPTTTPAAPKPVRSALSSFVVAGSSGLVLIIALAVWWLLIRRHHSPSPAAPISPNVNNPALGSQPVSTPGTVTPYHPPTQPPSDQPPTA